MKKEKIRLFYGFTMAEILISIGIAMVLATALVPVFGTKKVKNPRPRIQHGLVACYYNANGKLQFEQYSAGGAGHKINAAKNSGSVCTVDVPKGSHVEIIAVGGGGNAHGADNPFGPELSIKGMQLGSTTASGSIRVDNYFQQDISSAASNDSNLPKKIRETLNEWATRYPNQVYAKYEITSPIGAGGTGKCIAVYANESCSAIKSAGSFYSPRTNYPTDNYDTDCWWYQHGDGGASGPGLRINDIAIPIKGSSAITVEATTNRAGVSVNTDGAFSSVSLSASGKGGDPERKRTDKGKDYYAAGLSSNVPSLCSTSGKQNLCSSLQSISGNSGGRGGTEIAYAQKCTDNEVPARSGIVTSSSPAFTWEYGKTSVNPRFSKRGNYGSEVFQTFENLEGFIELKPGKAGKASSVVKKENGKSVTIITANGGKDGGEYTGTSYFDIKEQIPTEIRELGKADNETHFTYLNKVKGSGFNLSASELIKCEYTKSCPGYAGTGAYLFISYRKNVPPSLESLRIINRQAGSGSNYRPGSYTKYFADTGSEFNKYPTCPGDIEMPLGSPSWASECIGSQPKGIGGAIIVIW